MRMRPLLAGAAGLAAIVATAAPASAVKYGEPDAGEHPYVGLMVAYVTGDGDGDGDEELVAAWRCTGTQIDGDTFLTAGHCTSGAEAVAIWFGDDLEEARVSAQHRFFDVAISDENDYQADAYSTTPPLTHPEYTDDAFYLHDVGIVNDVVFTEGFELDSYGQLPKANYWDEQIAAKKKDRDSYTTVGYGLQWAMPDRGKSAPEDSNRRLDQAQWLKLKAGGELIGYRNFGAGKANDAYVVLTNNANTGGTCFGDSGGPTFIEDTRTVVAVTSFGMNSTCAGTSGVYRIDTADDLAWLDQFID